MENKKNNTPRWYFLFVWVLCILFFVGCGPRKEKLELKLFENDSYGLSFLYPKNWYIKSYYLGSNSYSILASEQEVTGPSYSYWAGMAITLIPANPNFPASNQRHALKSSSRYIKKQNAQAILKNSEIFEEKEITINEMSGFIQKVSGEGLGYQKKYYRRSLFTAVAMNSNMIIYIIGEMPHEKLKKYEPIFTEMIKSVRVSSVMAGKKLKVSAKTIKKIAKVFYEENDVPVQTKPTKKWSVKIDTDAPRLRWLADIVCGENDKLYYEILDEVSLELGAAGYKLISRYEPADIVVFFIYREKENDLIIDIVNQKTRKGVNSAPVSISKLNCSNLAKFLYKKIKKGLFFAEDISSIKPDDILDFQYSRVRYTINSESGQAILFNYDYTSHRPDLILESLNISLSKIKPDGYYSYNIFSEQGNEIIFKFFYTHGRLKSVYVDTTYKPSSEGTEEKTSTIHSVSGCKIDLKFIWKDGQLEQVSFIPRKNPFFDERLNPFYDIEKGYF